MFCFVPSQNGVEVIKLTRRHDDATIFKQLRLSQEGDYPVSEFIFANCNIYAPGQPVSAGKQSFCSLLKPHVRHIYLLFFFENSRLSIKIQCKWPNGESREKQHARRVRRETERIGTTPRLFCPCAQTSEQRQRGKHRPASHPKRAAASGPTNHNRLPPLSI